VRRLLAATALLALTGLGACGSSAHGEPGAVQVVASTDVWSDVVGQLAGRLAGSKVVITSFINGSTADPHAYEASTRDQLAISRADLIVENGGGYDDFMDTLRRSAGGSATTLDAVELAGHGTANEHVWYDFRTVLRVADRITAFLVRHDRADAATYRANSAGFAAQLARLGADEQRIKRTHAGDAVAITEPVPLYLLSACGLVNRTPVEFSKAVEDGTDVSPRVLQQTLGLFGGHQVEALVYNAQTTGPQTDRVRSAAQAAGVPAVPVTETLPPGKTFYSWMHDQLDALSAALDRR
jgi:zinc/manganese transport system substrate-binding protein